MIPVNVADDHVGNIVGFESRFFDSLGRLHKIRGLPAADKFIAIEAAIEQNVLAPAFDQPDVHGNVHLPVFIGARNKPGQPKNP